MTVKNKNITSTNDMPVLQPIPINTKGLSFLRGIWRWMKSKRSWLLMEDFIYRDMIVPKGYIFDGASVPRILWSVLSPVGLLLIPSLFHDFIYDNGFYLRIVQEDWEGEKENSSLYVEVVCTRAEADRIFYDLAYEVNGVHFADLIAYVGVRVGGWLPWSRNRKERAKMNLESHLSKFR